VIEAAGIREKPSDGRLVDYNSCTFAKRRFGNGASDAGRAPDNKNSLALHTHAFHSCDDAMGVLWVGDVSG